jgi:peptidoglycan/LPS O-acetylase OafA/YrhL
VTVSAHLSFRSDVDYLRAIAVLVVVGFHYQVPGLSGGFVGVDIFFVISGFVIARLLWAGIQTGTFSFSEFYDRRARRLLPALYSTIVVTGVAAWFLAPPDDYKQFFGSAVSTLLFSSNIFFWLQANYFDLPTIGKALIHTWSLAVEEQFYFLFPVMTWLWSKTFRDPSSRVSLVLIISGTAALCLADELVIKRSATAAFYLSPLRAWEFLIGSIAFFIHRWSPTKFYLRCGYALAGFVLMLISAISFRVEMRFPGFSALIPCLGAALYIIAFNQEGKRPPLPFEKLGLSIGRMSYSIYLWHWPVLLLGRAALPLDIATSVIGTAGLLLCSFAFAYVSYQIIEAPTRRRAEWNGIRVSGLIAGTAAVLISVGTWGLFENGYPERFSQSQQRMLRYSGQTIEAFYGAHTCFLQPDEPFSAYNSKECLTFVPHKQNVLIAGDSTAAHYVWAFRDYMRSGSYNVMQLTSGNCAPFLEVEQDYSRNCHEMSQLLFEQIKNGRLSALILSGNWSYYVGAHFPPPSGNVRQEGSRALTSPFDLYFDAILSAAEDASLPVLLLGPSLEFPLPVASTLFQYEQTHLPVGKAFEPVDAAFKADDHLRALSRYYPNVQFVSVLDAVCDGRQCPVKVDPETPIVWDTIHLTPEGSKFVVSKLKPQLDAFLTKLEQPPTRPHPASTLPANSSSTSQLPVSQVQ